MSSLIGVVDVKPLFLSDRFYRSIFGSITSVAAGRLDVSKGRQVEIDDGFERFRCRAVLSAIWKCFEPVRLLGLQRKQYADGVTPTLGAAPSIGRAV